MKLSFHAGPACALLLAVGSLLVARLPVGAADRATLKNAGFEAGGDGWTLTTYGARAAVEKDAEVVHDGKPSLRVSAAEPSDTALSQEVRLESGRLYRLSARVRTRNLDPHGAPVYGTMQVQHPGGHGTIAAGNNHGGDSDWKEVAVYFEAPPGGLTRVCLFFVGFGKGTGTAWFADVRLEEVDPRKATLKVTRDLLRPDPINPMQYGQFIEYLCDLVPGMWAEKLYDGSFEGLTPYKFAYLRQTDFREKPWYPSGATNRAEYTADRNDPVSGTVCQKIAVTGAAPCTVGISQDGIAVERDRPCTFRCYFRQEGVKGPVQVRLHREGKLLASAEFSPGGTWKKYSAKLTTGETETNATLSISFRGPGTLWLDNASLMPDDAAGGWRPDVVAAVKALKPGVIRFGGSALDEPGFGEFDWKDTIGDPDKRRPFRAWGGLQPTGPGLEEVVQFCRLAGAEPLLCVRVTGRTPKDAAEQVQYFIGAADTPMGKLRVKNGHADPYGVKFWQVGNERSGADYEARLADFSKAMREVDPSITLLSSYPTAGVLRKAGDQIDYVSPHHYDCADLAGCEKDLDAVSALCRSLAPKRKIKVAVTEWNTTAGDWGPRRARLWTLENALACSRYHNLLHRHSDVVDIANRSNLTNSFCSGIIQTDNHRLYRTPTYYAQQFYATLAGNRALRVESPLPAALKPDVSATLSADGTTMTLFAVNAGAGDVTRPVDLSAFGNAGQEVEVWTLADHKGAGEADVTNSFGEPERVAPVKSRFKAESGTFEHKFPALSLTVLRWRVGK
jgi:alpha-N-arabinofuranosidase